HPPTKLALIVEDDPDLAITIGDALEAAGFQSEVAAHGLDAIAQLRAGLRPVVILLDMMMPVMDGWGFRVEQAKLPDAAAIPVIALTADGDAKHKAASIHASGYLAKPVALQGEGDAQVVLTSRVQRALHVLEPKSFLLGCHIHGLLQRPQR